MNIDSKKTQKESEKKKPLIIKSFIDIPDRKTEWLWENYFAIGTLNSIQGVQGDGKTFFCCGLAAIISNGGVSNHPVLGTIKGGTVLYQSAEDPDYILKERIINAGGNLNNISCVDTEKMDIDLNTNSSEIEELISIIKPKIVILDTISSFLSQKLNTNQQNQVRGELKPLLRLAQKYNTCVVFVAHTSKSGHARGVQRMIGSVDFTAACRSVMEVSIDRETDITNVMNVKNNLQIKQAGVGYRIINDELQWVSPSKTEDEIDATFGGTGRQPTKQKIAENAIIETLKNAVDGNGKYQPVKETDLKNAIVNRYRIKVDTYKLVRMKLTKEKVIQACKDGFQGKSQYLYIGK